MKISAKQKAAELIKQSGIDTARLMVSNVINELSAEGFAYSNPAQISFWARVNKYLTL